MGEVQANSTINVQLVESLVKIIDSLSTEERRVLESHLNRKRNWEASKQRLTELHQQITARRGGKPLDISADETAEMIHQMREERDQQILEAMVSQKQDGAL